MINMKELYMDILKSSMKDDEIKEALENMEEYIQNTRISNDYYETKKKLIASTSVLTSYIVEQLYLNTVGQNQTIQALVSKLTKVFNDNNLSYTEIVRLTSYFIDIAKGYIYEIKRVNNELMVNSLIVLDDDESSIASTITYPPPSLEVPEVPVDIILGHGLNNHNDKVCVDVIKLLQKIKWNLDPYIASMEEEVNKDIMEFQDVESINKFIKDSKRIREDYKDKDFYFEWRFDKRGRQYMSGYHINLQSTGFKKAIMSFGEPELLTGEL